jgi:DNA-binding transcriptional MerR regulator
MRIGEFAKRVGLTEYTIRYYEKAGVLQAAKRNGSGFRDFDESDLAWMEFVQRLKATGMPLEKIVRYAELRAAGDGTKAERDHEGERTGSRRRAKATKVKRQGGVHTAGYMPFPPFGLFPFRL